MLQFPGGCEGQKLHPWLAARCQSAQSGGAKEGGLFRDRSQGSGEIHNVLIIDTKMDERHCLFGVKVTVKRLTGRYEPEKGQRRGGEMRVGKEGMRVRYRVEGGVAKLSVEEKKRGGKQRRGCWMMLGR